VNSQSIFASRTHAAWYRIWGVLIVLAFAYHASIAQCIANRKPQRHISYSFEPIFSADRMGLRVTLEFSGGRSGEAELEAPSSYAGQKELTNGFDDFRVLSNSTTLTETSTPSSKILRFPAHALVRISYVLVKDWNGPLNSDTRFRPILERNYFQILSDTALIKPKLEPASTQDVYFDWQKLPASWSLATSFGVDDRCQSFHGAWKNFETALFVGGDYRIQRAKVSGNSLFLATRGKWSFTDDEWAMQVQRIIDTERNFWHDNSFPYQLVTLAPFDQDGGSYCGSAYTNAFMMHLPRKATFSYTVISLLAHENFHIWNPYKMGGEQGTAMSWFTEGFTRYYTDLILFRTGFLTLSEYIDHTNEKLRKYELSPARNISNAELTALHESDRSLSDVAGERGMVVALWLDSHIRQQTKNRASLDSIMLELFKEGKSRDFRLTIDRIVSISRKYLTTNDGRLLRRYIEVGSTIPVPEFALAPCVRVRTERAPGFELGFDEESVRTKFVVSGVKPDSEAFKAGVRDGQKITRYSVNWNDTSKPVRLTVRSSDGDHTFEYYPRGPSREIQQYYMDVNCSP
jgi:predicted metalloprotease with PDZ domain